LSAPDPALDAFLRESGLAAPGAETHWRALSGGISSEIWQVETQAGSICVKRALAKLNVAADWRAPVERNALEWAYFETAAAIVPDAVPRLLAHDPARGLFAMEWLAPERYANWKAELLAGRVDPAAAAAVGAIVGRIHAATAHDAEIARRFASDETFHALRIDAYLLATAAKHPPLASALHALATRTAATKLALVHGDVSPKNILLGPKGPVLLDAETAWYGDPAFDLAFCLNHLAIKRFVVRKADQALAASFARLAEAYLAHVDWEAPAGLEARAATLLPALALARVDGKSPVEYLDETERAALRARATAALSAAPQSLSQARDWLTP
jgi:aminoglycoside phosphotransferase (APT) family kinase protein